MPCHEADSARTTENRQRTSGGLRCAGQSRLQDPLCKEEIIADRGLNLVACYIDENGHCACAVLRDL